MSVVRLARPAGGLRQAKPDQLSAQTDEVDVVASPLAILLRTPYWTSFELCGVDGAPNLLGLATEGTF